MFRLIIVLGSILESDYCTIKISKKLEQKQWLPYEFNLVHLSALCGSHKLLIKLQREHPNYLHNIVISKFKIGHSVEEYDLYDFLPIGKLDLYNVRDDDDYKQKEPSWLKKKSICSDIRFGPITTVPIAEFYFNYIQQCYKSPFGPTYQNCAICMIFLYSAVMDNNVDLIEYLVPILEKNYNILFDNGDNKYPKIILNSFLYLVNCAAIHPKIPKF